jgi:hypothetical protein
MRTYHILDRVLGVLWLAFCSSYVVFMVWEICHVFAISRPQNEDSIWLRFMGVSVLISLVFFVGAVASVFLLRGATWARKSVGFVAIIVMLLAVANWSLDFWAVVQGVFALISACCLLFPRRVPPNNSLQATATAPSVLTGT